MTEAAAATQDSPVWFYLLSATGDDARLRAACRIAEKAWSGGRKVLVCAAHPREAADFDRLLWTFKPDSFVPHALAHNAEHEDTVVIDTIGGRACSAAAEGGELDVLLMLYAAAPGWGLSARRVATIIGADAKLRDDGRAAYRQWQALGVRPHTVEV